MTKKFFSVFVAVLILASLVGCAASEKNEQSGAAESVQKDVSRLTVEEAQTVALEHAGVTAEQVTQLRFRYKVDDAIPEYEVEFRQGDYEYDYTVHAETGTVLDWDKEFDPINTHADAPAVQDTTPETKPATRPSVAEQSMLSREEARDIALKHAGFKPSQVKGLEIEYDVDDGIPEYSVEFHADGWEYEYEIHAVTGKILEQHKDRENH